MHVLSSLKDYAGDITEKVKEITPLGGEADKAEKAKTTSDPEFEAARKEWGRLNAFLTSMLESVVQTTTAHRELSKPVDILDNTVSLFYRESKQTSKEVTQFTSSVGKMKEGTMKFGEMILSYNIKEELESWLAKLAETKREINQRDTLMLKYLRGEAEHKSTRSKAEQKGMLRDAATVVKLNKMEAEWTGDKEVCTALNAKIINDVNGMSSRIFTVINEQLKTLATSQFWLYWALSEGYSQWHQQELNKSSIRQRRRPTNVVVGMRGGEETQSVPDNPPATPTPAATPTPVATPEKPTESGKQLPVPPKKVPPSPGGKALPTPPPKKSSAAPATAEATPATPTTAAPTTTTTTAPAPLLSSSELKVLELQKRNLDEEKADLEKERERLRKEWQEVEDEKIRFIRVKKDELQKIEEAKTRNEEDYKERLKQLDAKHQVLEAERKAVAEEKMRLEKRIELEEERIVQRKKMEEEYKKMEEERKSLEEKKLELAEGKMKKRLEEEWRRLEAKRVELEEERKKEEDRRRQQEEARIDEEKKRLEWETAERRRKEEEAQLEEQKERERLDRIKRQMEEERRRLEQTKRRLIEEDDVMAVMVPVIDSEKTLSTPKETPTPTSDTTTAVPSPNPTPTPVPTTEATVVVEKQPEATQQPATQASDEPTITKLLVKALYKYDAAEEGELSFAQGEIMIVDYDGDETGWWMAKKRNGEQGIVPANFVKKYDPENDDVAVEKKEAAAEAITPTTTAPAAAATAPPQATAPQQEPQPQPQPQPQSQPQPQPQQAQSGEKEAEKHISLGLTSGDLGKVRALFDYNATEEGELTFKKGDIIALLEKDSEGGWWIGELNGEMGLFPKTYVEEITSASSTPTTTPTTTTPVVAEQATPATTTSPRSPTPATTTPTASATPTSPRSPTETAAGGVKKPFGGVKMFPDIHAAIVPQQEYVKAAYDYTAQEEGELSFKEGDTIKVVEKKDKDGNEGWWTGSIAGKVGTFPTNFTTEPYFA